MPQWQASSFWVFCGIGSYRLRQVLEYQGPNVCFTCVHLKVWCVHLVGVILWPLDLHWFTGMKPETKDSFQRQKLGDVFPPKKRETWGMLSTWAHPLQIRDLGVPPFVCGCNPSKTKGGGTWRIIPFSKWLGSPPCIRHEKAIWKGNNPS